MYIPGKPDDFKSFISMLTGGSVGSHVGSKVGSHSIWVQEKKAMYACNRCPLIDESRNTYWHKMYLENSTEATEVISWDPWCSCKYIALSHHVSRSDNIFDPECEAASFSETSLTIRLKIFTTEQRLSNPGRPPSSPITSPTY